MSRILGFSRGPSRPWALVPGVARLVEGRQSVVGVHGDEDKGIRQWNRRPRRAGVPGHLALVVRPLLARFRQVGPPGFAVVVPLRDGARLRPRIAEAGSDGPFACLSPRTTDRRPSAPLGIIRLDPSGRGHPARTPWGRSRRVVIGATPKILGDQSEPTTATVTRYNSAGMPQATSRE